MDVSEEGPAPEPDVVMDSDEDFAPGDSEDEAAPRNTEIAKTIQKTQEDMVKQVGKTRKEGEYQVGDWVSLDSEARPGKTKMDAVRYGPFKVVGRSKERPANYELLYLGIPGSNKDAHTERLRIWPGIGEKVDRGKYQGPPFVAGQSLPRRWRVT